MRWIEHHPPYNYASDDNGRNKGYLITTWLSAGLHRFTVRVTDVAGQVAADTVTARVVAAPSPPAALGGAWWERIVPRGAQFPFAGRWLLRFDRVGEWHIDPTGSGVVDQFDVRGHTLDIYAPIQAGPFTVDHGKCNGLGCTALKRDGHAAFGNDCNNSGPFGRYTWSVTGRTLRLRRIYEGCRGRGKLLGATWTRVG